PPPLIPIMKTAQRMLRGIKRRCRPVLCRPPTSGFPLCLLPAGQLRLLFAPPNGSFLRALQASDQASERRALGNPSASLAHYSVGRNDFLSDHYYIAIALLPNKTCLKQRGLETICGQIKQKLIRDSLAGLNPGMFAEDYEYPLALP